MTGSNKEYITKSVNDFESFLKEIKNADAHIRKTGNIENVIFRGQSLDKDLFPKLGRDDYKVDNREEYEKKIFTEFKRLFFPYVDLKNINEWDSLAIAQHHCLPTRLLDWTENPLIALWFAFNEEKKDDTERVVWCFGFEKKSVLKPGDKRIFSQQKTIVYKPRHVTQRITNQNGWFTSHYYRSNKNKYSALNNLKAHWPHLYKITFKNKTEKFRQLIISQLDVFGVNHASIYPDLEGLCRYLDWKTYKKQ